MQKLVIAAAFALVALSYVQAAHPPSDSWESFKSFHSKSYQSPKHEAAAKENFHKNAAAVKAHNAAFKAGKVSYTKELNAFSDMDPAKFKERNGFKPPASAQTRSIPVPAPSMVKRDEVPAKLDWRDQGKVSPVKDQGQCGSCWSFSATGAMEGNALMQNKSNLIFSEQQILDCDIGAGDQGCNGGWPYGAWSYIKGAGGDESESAYSYWSGTWGFSGFWCCADKSKFIGTVDSYDKVTPGSTAALMQALADKGPISIAVDASGWQNYQSGVYACPQQQPGIDHAVLVVGYGTGSSGDYWIVKNSWGTGWGQQGYIYLARDNSDGGQIDCGITQYPYWVKVA